MQQVDSRNERRQEKIGRNLRRLYIYYCTIEDHSFRTNGTRSNPILPRDP